jgi:adenosylcobinamide-phosphate synthase
VAAFGAAASWLEARCYADRRTAGVLHAAALTGAAIGLGTALERLVSHRSLATVMTTAVATWAVLGGQSLNREATTVAGQLTGGKLITARDQVRHLVGRDTAELSSAEVARATVESVAENASDAVVAPLLWGAVAGVPGLLGYRAANTLDAMIGHRSVRYLKFGWAAARMDDIANWAPARLVALAAAAWAPLVGGTTRNVIDVVRRDAGQHPSPNAGVVEAAFAGALDVRLGGQNAYHGAVEDRGILGNGRPVAVADIARATRLASAVSLSALGLAVLIRGLRS